jgi:hypothetical protein
MMRRVVLGMVLVALATALGSTSASAHAGGPSDAFSTKANAICAKAIGQAKAAGRIYTFAHPNALFAAVKAKGASWVAVDTATLKALKALKPGPSVEPSTWKVMLVKHQQAIDDLVKAIAAARAGKKQAFVDLFTKSSTEGAGFGLRAFTLDLSTCENWVP